MTALVDMVRSVTLTEHGEGILHGVEVCWRSLCTETLTAPFTSQSFCLKYNYE